jgi:hypothetical protein
MAPCFLARQLTDLLQPELLSVGLVDLAGAEHYVAGKDGATEYSRFVRTDGFRRLVEAAGGCGGESWTRQWLLQPAHELGRRPLDIAREPDDIAILVNHLERIRNG